MPLPDAVTRLLDENTSLLALIEQAQARDDRKVKQQLNDQTLDSIRHLREQFKGEFIAAGTSMWNSDTVDEIWSFGPHECGSNILLNRIPNSIYKQRSSSIWTTALLDSTNSSAETVVNKDDYYLSVINGFQMATAKGSLCDEPLMGVAFIIEAWKMDVIVDDETNGEPDKASDVQGADLTAAVNPGADEVESLVETMSINSDDSSSVAIQEKPRRVIHKSRVIMHRGPLAGQIVSTVRDGCRKAFDSQPRRLVAAMYKCEVMVNVEALGRANERPTFTRVLRRSYVSGRAYVVLNKRNGRVLNEGMKDGTSTFIITATLPVAESFGFGEEMRKKASGLASPQLSGKTYWEIIELDPFWEPQTEEEVLHFGEKADFENRARKYMNDVRRRKGLRVEEKIVEHAEKQRTLKRNK